MADRERIIFGGKVHQAGPPGADGLRPIYRTPYSSDSTLQALLSLVRDDLVGYTGSPETRSEATPESEYGKPTEPYVSGRAAYGTGGQPHTGRLASDPKTELSVDDAKKFKSIYEIAATGGMRDPMVSLGMTDPSRIAVFPNHDGLGRRFGAYVPKKDEGFASNKQGEAGETLAHEFAHRGYKLLKDGVNRPGAKSIYDQLPIGAKDWHSRHFDEEDSVRQRMLAAGLDTGSVVVPPEDKDARRNRMALDYLAAQEIARRLPERHAR